ncbi:FecR family protein [Chitinophaga rupis]|uniref:FecR family protein n=1 Tax=Chitinophaga rupis TaxID=573321 RepID=A0A1H7GNU3_9BACT|nr:FecR family protein [Chitinophaga rupis]SEK39729.1 FecR family protein [Chitinophaga rupis]
MQTSSRLSTLFQRWFKGQASPSETEELMGLLEGTDPDQELPALLKAEWDDLQTRQVYTDARKDEMVDMILRHAPAQRPVRPLRTRMWWAAAAALVCIVAGAALWLNRQPLKKSPAAIAHTVKDVAPGKQGAVLTLANGKSIVLDSTGNGVIASQNGTQVIYNNGSLVYDAGAAGGISYNTITTPYGRKFRLVLPDNTTVWLNAGSSLRYPTAFTGAERLVEVTGEAYFEIAKNPAAPFLVKVNDQTQVKVLGTSFNVNAYNDEANVNVTLLQGAVLVETAGGRKLQVRPGQQARVQQDASITLLDNVNTDQVIAWKEGYFNFEGASLQQVMRQLARWYDIEVVYEGNKIPDITFEGELPSTLQLTQMLKILSRVEVKYRIEEEKRLIILP